MGRTTAFDRFLHAGRIVAACSMGGTVAAGILFSWIPALASVDVHAIGGAVGGVLGLVATMRHSV
jgi:hypothetical protein